MDKLDLKKSRKELFNGKRDQWLPVGVSRALYLKVDGHGDPNTSPAYTHAIESLYAMAYTIKFKCKSAGRDFVVAPLEGLWSAKDPKSFTARRKDEWDWTMMIMVPDFVDQRTFDEAKVWAADKRGALAESLRLEALEEGLCLQALHIGSYDEEGPLLATLHDEVMPSGGFTFAGPHHEVYLGDLRKVVPEKLRTILRQPVRKASA